MGNRFLEVISEAESNRWCMDPNCSTCYGLDFRGAVARIHDLQHELETVDPAELITHKDWERSLQIVAQVRTFPVDWTRVLSKWGSAGRS